MIVEAPHRKDAMRTIIHIFSIISLAKADRVEGDGLHVVYRPYE